MNPQLPRPTPSFMQRCLRTAATVAVLAAVARRLNDEVERTIGPIHCATDRIAVR